MKPPVTPDYSALHGHVASRPDGKRSMCGGPALCQHCQGELALLSMMRPGFEANVRGLRELSAALVFSRRWAKWWKDAAIAARGIDESLARMKIAERKRSL